MKGLQHKCRTMLTQCLEKPNKAGTVPSTPSSEMCILEFSFLSVVHNCWGQGGGGTRCSIPDITDGVVCYLLSHVA